MQDSSDVPAQFINELAKINQLLRMFRIAKKNQKLSNNLTTKVKEKIDKIITTLKSFSQFGPIQDTVMKKIQAAFEQPKPVQVYNTKPAKSVIQVPQTRNVSGQNIQKMNQNITYPSPPKSVIVQKQKPQSTSSFNNNQYPPPPLSVSTPYHNTSAQNLSPTFAIIQPKQIIVEEPVKATNTPSQIKKIVEAKSESFVELNSLQSLGNISSINQNTSNPNIKSNSFNANSMLNMMDLQVGQSMQIDFSKKSEQLININSQQPQQFQQQDLSQKFSQHSQYENIIDNIIRFCSDNKDKLNSQIVFNDDIFKFIREEEGEFVYLFGVNKPEGKKIQKLYACTLMKFSIAQIYKGDDKFDKQIRDFKNNIRTPMGLIISGQNSNAIMPEYLKYLINIQSPFPIVLVLKNYNSYDGVMCTFHQSIIDRVRQTIKKQLGQCAEELKKRIKQMPFNQSFLPKEKIKYVITKFLNRNIPNIAEEAPNAITISGGDCIRPAHIFPYKTHTKFLPTTKPDFCIYYAINGVITTRIGFKDFEQFKKEALSLQSKVPCIFSANVTRDINPIRKQFFQVLFQCNNKRDPFIFINLSNLNLKKTVIAILKKEVTMQMLQTMEPIQYKNFQKETAITECVHIISKNNFKEFQVEGKVQLIECKPK